VFVNGVDDDFNMTEELAGIQSINDRTIGKDFCSEIVDFVDKKNI